MHKSAVDRESCISAVRVRGRLRFVGRGHSGEASMNAIRAGSISALGVDQDLVDHRDCAVAPDLKQENPARGGDPARERRDVHLMGDQDDGFRGRQAQQGLPEFGRLRAGLGRVPEERVQRGQVLDRTQAQEPGRVAAAAPLACLGSLPPRRSEIQMYLPQRLPIRSLNRNGPEHPEKVMGAGAADGSGVWHGSAGP